jgi:hypothetical protein
MDGQTDESADVRGQEEESGDHRRELRRLRRRSAVAEDIGAEAEKIGGGGCD